MQRVRILLVLGEQPDDLEILSRQLALELLIELAVAGNNYFLLRLRSEGLLGRRGGGLASVPRLLGGVPMDLIGDPN